MNGFDVRFSYDSSKIQPSNLDTNVPTDDETEYFTYVGEFANAVEMFTIPYDGVGDGIRAITSFLPPTVESEHIIRAGVASGKVVNTQDGVLLGKMSFQMLVDEFDSSWFNLETSTKSSPKTGIKINIDETTYYEAQSTFIFTDQTASKDANLSNLIVSSGVTDINPSDSTYEEYNLDPTFDKDIYDYQLKLYEYIDEIEVKATLSDTKATMKIKVPKRDDDNNLIYESDGNTIVYEEKDIENNTPLQVVINKLGEPDTEITISVVAEDGKTTNEYKLVVKRPYGTIKGKIYTEPTNFTTGKYIADVLAYLDSDTQGIVNWSEAINSTIANASDNLNTLLRGDEETLTGGITEKSKITTNEDGTFEMYLIPGTYDLLIDKKGYLDQYYINMDLAESETIDLNTLETNGIIELTPGDINKDGIVGILDKTIMTKQNGKSESTDLDFNAASDFNNDGSIDISDKAVLTKKNNSKREIIDLKGGII